MVFTGYLVRREFLRTGLGMAAGMALLPRCLEAAPRLRVTALELLPVRATARTVWLFVRLRTDAGLTGLGEASDAFGFANTTQARCGANGSGVADSSFAWSRASRRSTSAPTGNRASRWLRGRGLVAATAYSAIEQALWDLAGKALDVPTYTLVRRKAARHAAGLRQHQSGDTSRARRKALPPPARAAVKDGFRAVKAAPFDGFPPPGRQPAASRRLSTTASPAWPRCATPSGRTSKLMVDCHSFFDVPLAERVARRLEPLRLAWYEEPVAPERTRGDRRNPPADSAADGRWRSVVRRGRLRAAQPQRRPSTSIMPDVKHCGGLLEMTRIAAMADADGVAVAPHNPSGPVSTAASVQVCAVLKNFRLLEFQWGEVDWRHDVLEPREMFLNGTIGVPDRPGFGVELNDRVVRAHPL